jgi:hypothetical protein
MTKLDDLRDFVRNKNKKKDNDNKMKSEQETETEKETFSLEVAGSDASANPLSSFGTEETDPDLISQVYHSNRNRVPRGEGASSWDQD